MRLVFVYGRKDAHVRRFSELFSTLTDEYFEVSYSQDLGQFMFSSPDLECVSWSTLRSQIEAKPSVVVSGPLDSVSKHLAGGDYRHVGISWATDVMVSGSASLETMEQLSRTVCQLDYVVTDNYATENVLISLGAEPQSVLRFPWGPGELTLGTPAHDLDDFGLPQGKTLILSVRSIDSHYEPETVLRAFAMVFSKEPKAHLILIRRGQGVAFAEELIDSLGLGESVTWVENLEPEQFNCLIALSHVVVSSAKTDGTSVSVLEAMARSVPVIATLTNGSSEWLIDGVTGWTYAPGHENELAAKLFHVLTMEIGHREAIVENARNLVSKRAGWSRTSSAVSDALSELLRDG